MLFAFSCSHYPSLSLSRCLSISLSRSRSLEFSYLCDIWWRHFLKSREQSQLMHAAKFNQLPFMNTDSVLRRKTHLLAYVRRIKVNKQHQQCCNTNNAKQQQRNKSISMMHIVGKSDRKERQHFGRKWIKALAHIRKRWVDQCINDEQNLCGSTKLEWVFFCMKHK